MKLFFPLLVLTYSLFSQAELSSPFFLSQGGSGGASLKEDFSYLINPATMGFQKKTKGALTYSFKSTNFTPKKQTALLSFLDLKTKMPLAITYQRTWTDSFKKSEADTMFVSSGFRVTPYLSIGLTIEKELKNSSWNGGIGSILKFGNQTSMALFLNQILKKENKNQRALSLAFYHYWKPFFSTQLDITKTAHRKWIFRGGLESFFQNFFSIRLGGAWFQKTQRGLISGGLAFHSPKLRLEYSIEIERDEKQFQHAIVLILQI